MHTTNLDVAHIPQIENKNIFNNVVQKKIYFLLESLFST